MSLILNIDTATDVCSVTLSENAQIIARKEQQGTYSHAENLTLFITEVCSQANVSLNDLDAIAVGKGPGSYTGLRIGVSVAKGLCFALNKPLIAINTLQAMASGFSEKNHSVLPENALLCPMIDARRMEVYTALYTIDGNEKMGTCAMIISENSFENYLAKNKLFFFGNGAAKCKSVLERNGNVRFHDSPVFATEGMALLSNTAHEKKQFEDVAYFEPYYLKDFITTVPKKR
jgi:tRNA threonylcarbamoyladenosine biosynthesis protein TsaB